MGTHADLEATVEALKQANSGFVVPDDVQFALNSPVGPFIPNSVFDSLRNAAPPGFFDSNGQIANPVSGIPAPILPRPHTSDLQPPANLPGPPLGTPIDGTLAMPSNRLASIKKSPFNKSATIVPHDPIPTFIDGYNKIIGAATSGPGNTGWNATIEGVKAELQSALLQLNSGITGHFANALRNNLNRSFVVLQDMSHHAQTMEILFEAFFNDLATTKSNFERYAPTYSQAIQDPVKNKDTLNQLNGLVLDIMNVYRPPIDDIAASHPSIDSALSPVGSAVPGPTGPRSAPPPDASGAGAPETLTPVGINTGDRLDPTASDNVQPANESGQAAPDAQNSGAGDQGNNDAGQSQQAGGQGASKASADAAKVDAKHPAGPHGLLGAGAKGPSGISKTGGGSRGAVGTGGRAAGSLGMAKPPTVGAAKLGAAPTPASRAGVSGAGGQGGAGTPVAGHQGGTAAKTHKTSKALKRREHGEEVVGETKAVAPVIGDVPKKPAKRT